MSDNGESNRTLIFSYGTLKRGFANHSLMQSLITTNNAIFLGTYSTSHPLPLVRGPHGVPFLLNLPNTTHHRVHGELYSVSPSGLERLDELEGITLGHYERLPISIRPESDDVDFNGTVVEAEAYYANRSFAAEMWRRNGKVRFEVYTEDLAKDYVKRDARPKDRSFLEEIRVFCSSNSSVN